jgi:hypothetical protein
MSFTKVRKNWTNVNNCGFSKAKNKIKFDTNIRSQSTVSGMPGTAQYVKTSMIVLNFGHLFKFKKFLNILEWS